MVLRAQTPVHLPPGGLIQLQVTQPAVDVTTPVTATAEFDPPMVPAGGKTYYRVNVDATESSVQWPDQLPAPGGLRFGANARGMTTEIQANGFRPITEFAYEVQATAAGHFTITNFTVDVSGTPVEIPAASLDVLSASAPMPANAPAARQLILQLSETNLFLGQPFRVRVILPPGPGFGIEPLREAQLNGDGFMTDKTSLRQVGESVNVNGQLRLAFVNEMVATPIAAGPLKLSAQGFTIERGPSGQPKYTLLFSDPIEVEARPLPVEGELPGFTGAIGKFFHDPLQLSADHLHVGEPAQLKITFHGEGDLSRFAPPMAPRSRDWQIIADPPPATSFTLIPLTDETHGTPAIPFSYFDPNTAKYVDLTIPSIPVTVVGDALPVELPAYDEEGKAAPPIKLSPLAATPGKSVSSLRPLQRSVWFAGLQLVPLAGFVVLWQWDRRRRYLEAHPEIVRRTQARRALRREKLQLQKAAAAGDTAAFVQHAARAMSIAVAPHFPANPQALVGGDVVAQLDEAVRSGQAGETVKKVFAAADAQFASAPQTLPDLPALQNGVDAVLERLEEKL